MSQNWDLMPPHQHIFELIYAYIFQQVFDSKWRKKWVEVVQKNWFNV